MNVVRADFTAAIRNRGDRHTRAYGGITCAPLRYGGNDFVMAEIIAACAKAYGGYCIVAAEGFCF